MLGYALRFPGATDAGEFWELMADGREAVSVVPGDRWDADEFYDPDPDAPGKMVARRAGFVDDVAGFDAPFFGVSAREAMFMDPQHRQMLETTWAAIEHAGMAPSGLAGTQTGVFMGLSTHEFAGMMIRLSRLEDIDFYSGTGCSAAAGAGRISFRLGLKGPAMVVDTACSSSLVALHQACQALDSDDCDLALVGGVNVILTPIPMINFSRARMLAPDGRCKTFDAAADGYVRGEGCGVVVLKRIDDALRDGDSIRAVIRGTAVNQDGASGGLTVPNGTAQQEVIATALRRAGVEAADVDYLEAHGTGTSLGDPIEVQAAGAVFGEGRAPDRPLLIGSVKTNIGHLEAASGIAGLIKVALALEHEVLPKHLHFTEPSPYIPWDRLPVRVVEQATAWQRNGRPRIAGVSSFGFSGTNAHVVVEEAPAVGSAADGAEESGRGGCRLLPLSARTPEALAVLASRYRDWMDANPDVALADICATAGAGRSHFEHRAALVVDSRARARRLLGALHDDRPAPGLTRGTFGDRPKTAWLFPGQGSQFPGMARTLFESEPIFRETIQRCADVLEPVLPRSLLEVMFDTGPDGEEALRDTAFAQPALFAVEVGLARLWRSWGIQPDVVVGHSVGQYAAACVAGVFGLDDGARLIAERGRLFGTLPAGGRMVAVFADADKVEQCAAEYPRLSIAAYNGASTVLSGPGEDTERAAEAFTDAGIRCEWLQTSHAFHSALLDPVLDEFESYASNVDYSPPQVTFVCNRTGDVLTRRSRLDAQYWRRHARQPVRFADSVATLADQGCGVLIELGPQPILTAAAMRAWPDAAPAPHTIASLRRGTDDRRCLTEALAAAYTSGHRLDFVGRCTRPNRPVDLPTYPFQHRTYWFPAYTAPDLNSRARAGASWSGESGTGQPMSAQAAEAPPAEVRTTDWLLDQPPEQRLSRITDVIVAELANALRTSVDELDPNAEFMSLGMDSLTAMDLRRRLQAALGIELPASLFFAHPTVTALAEGLLAMWLDNSSDQAMRQLAIPRAVRDGELPLSHAQEQLWFLHELLPSSSAYHVSARIDIPGPVDRQVLQRSFDAVMARHEVLRTTCRSVEGVPQAVLATPQPFELPFERVSEADVAVVAEGEAAVPFDLAVGPLLRARLLEFGAQRHALVLTMHHIVTDGWSFRVLLRELGLIYHAFERGEPIPLAELPIQYPDYAQWQRARLRGPDFDAHLDFWRNDLAGAPLLELDTDRPRPKTPTFRGARTQFALGPERASALRGLCRGENVTVSVPLLAAFAALLARYSGQDDVVVGTLTANRTRVETEDLIGLFVNALPVRIRLDGDPDGTKLLSRIRQRMVEVLAHQDVPFDLIVNATAPDRDANRNPLFSVQLVVQPAAGGAELSGLGLEVAEIGTHTAKRDLTFTFFDDDQLSGHVEYAAELFDAVRIDRMIAHFRVVLDAMAGDLGLRLSELPMLTESESSYYQPISSPRRTAARSVSELFEMTVDRTPDAVAVTVASRSFTYRELDAAANRLARLLRNRGVDVGSAVGLCVGRTAAMAIGMLGILKAGGVYVPIDPSYPKDRVNDMLAEAGVVLLLGEDDVDGEEVSQESSERLETATAPDDLAYVMYTSGSTGRPKGVAVSHGSVVEYAETLGREVGISAADVYLETASISFSSSIRQLMVPFAVGAQVVIATTEERRDPAELLRRISESRVTVADLVPTVVRGLVDAAATGTTPPPNGLRLLLTASEPLRLGLVRAWRDRFGCGATWINMYGQTETTGIVSVHPVGESDGGDQCIVPIGRPRGNVSMYVLDRAMRPVPPGVSGELFIAGPALARGYLGDPELTAERFVRAPWNADERLYASGDVVRLGWDGTIEYRNRTDRQVKIRGLRVEPAEVDRVLLEHSGVREAVTVVQSPDGDGSVLVAYFAPQGAPISVGELRAHARRQLPEHMMPSAFLAMDRLPQTANGKLDLAALPVVAITRDQEVEYVAPRGDVEEALASIWRSTLDVEQIGAGDNFFALGGHSLLAAQVRSRIRQHLGVELPLDVLFDDQTLAGLARRIEETATGTVEAPPLRPTSRDRELPASHAQETMWRAERDAPGSAAHWIDVSIRITGPLDATAIVRGVQDVVARNELLRTIFRSSEESSEPMLSQVILEGYMPEVPVWEAVPGADCTPDATEWRDLDTRPPFRADVTRIADDHHVLRLRVHRILTDGYSMRLLLSELGGLVASSLGFDGFPVLDGQLQYADYAVWERSWLTDEALTKRVDHFRRQFATADLPPALPTDHPRTDQPRRRGHQFAFELLPAVAAAARALAVHEQASLYSVLLAAFATAVGTYADQRTVVIASPQTRRTDPVTQLMIGPFMNTVPLRIDLDAGNDLPSLVRDVKTTVLGALSNQDAPWHLVLAALTEQHGPSALGIGEVVFLMDDPVPGELTAGGLSVSRIPADPIVLRRELTAALSTDDDQLTGVVTYDGALFEEKSIARIVSNFIAALTVSDAEKI
jgi:amino acid adenylation domain-containing protein